MILLKHLKTVSLPSWMGLIGYGLGVCLKFSQLSSLWFLSSPGFYFRLGVFWSSPVCTCILTAIQEFTESMSNLHSALISRTFPLSFWQSIIYPNQNYLGYRSVISCFLPSDTSTINVSSRAFLHPSWFRSFLAAANWLVFMPSPRSGITFILREWGGWEGEQSHSWRPQNNTVLTHIFYSYE